MTRSDVNAFVLAAGASTRMRCDKAFITFRGQTLLHRALQLASGVSDTVRIVGAQEKFEPYGVVIEDEFPGHGPLAGIHAALRASTAELNLMLAVDTPLLQPRFLQHLVERAAASQAIVTVPRAAEPAGSNARLHPLCAIYRRAFAPIAEQALRENRNRIDALFPQVETLLIEQQEIEQFGFDSAMFLNLNSAEDLHGLKEDLRPQAEPGTSHTPKIVVK